MTGDHTPSQRSEAALGHDRAIRASTGLVKVQQLARRQEEQQTEQSEDYGGFEGGSIDEIDDTEEVRHPIPRLRFTADYTLLKSIPSPLQAPSKIILLNPLPPTLYIPALSPCDSDEDPFGCPRANLLPTQSSVCLVNSTPSHPKLSRDV